MSSHVFETSFDYLLTSELQVVADKMMCRRWEERLLGPSPIATYQLVARQQLTLSQLLRFRHQAVKAFQQRSAWLPYLSDIQLLQSIGFHDLPEHIDRLIMHTALQRAELSWRCL
ncbi:hypothetical protein [Salinibius halmophilus]|uniref:hypothetical protein n=1 Tax=Salinibius halmophilus TaxID=1853216 RepID=UPI000E6738ED|nr:hypothetical protein [Salinibius halmophilus]